MNHENSSVLGPVIFTVVVTHNRKNLLHCALQAHTAQGMRPKRLLIVDNASDDGTSEMLVSGGWLNSPDVELMRIRENTGGAGGFAAGLSRAIECGADWVWMMDDDAEPAPNALEELMKFACDSGNIYGSLAVSGSETAWEVTLLNSHVGKTRRAADVPDCSEVETLPLLGLLVHRDLVARIGLIDSEFFIAGDDVEFCIRARRAGAAIMVVGQSKIHHPSSVSKNFHLFNMRVSYLMLPPWKRYYDTRNRLLIAKKYYGVLFFTKAVPGSFIRLFMSLFNEPRKLVQLRAFFAGFVDGVLGIKGKRHDFWGIK